MAPISACAAPQPSLFSLTSPTLTIIPTRAKVLGQMKEVSAPKPLRLSVSPSLEALGNDHLVDMFFSYLFPEDLSILPRAELVEARIHLRNMAITCRAFKDAALNRLWRCLDSLIPLIKLIPGHNIVNNYYVRSVL